MASLLELSHELLHCIFVEIEPADLSALSRACRALKSYIRGNGLLHKELYVRRYDEPSARPEPEWEQAIHDLVKLEKILQSPERDRKAAYLQFVAEQMTLLVETAKTPIEQSQNLDLLREYFRDNNHNVDAYLCASSLWERAGSERQVPAATPELRQASAKLHCLYGVPIDNVPSRYSFTLQRPNGLSPSMCTRLQSRSHSTHTFARSKVYDLREYTDGTLWGPFMADGSQRVDWEKVEAVMIVLGHNLNKFHRQSQGRWPKVWDQPFVGATPYSYLSRSLTPALPKDDADEKLLQDREATLALDAQDPYGVSGTWIRVVCFLDYNDLYAFNFSQRIPADEPREPIDTEEGIIDLAESVRISF
jgi:hypothetical protein